MVGLEVLRHSELFEGLSDDELAAIAHIAHEETFAPGTLILVENQAATDLYVVRDGRVAILTEIGRGRQTVIDTVMPGASFGWSTLVPPYVLTASARAMAQTRVIVIPGAELRELCHQNCQTCYTIMEKLATIISARLREARLQLIALLQA
jgi:CRP-like cAMP-binding protein